MIFLRLESNIIEYALDQTDSEIFRKKGLNYVSNSIKWNNLSLVVVLICIMQIMYWRLTKLKIDEWIFDLADIQLYVKKRNDLSCALQ